MRGKESYAQRDKPVEFKIRLLRVLAYYYEGLQDLDRASKYRHAALNEMEQALLAGPSTAQRLEYLFVSAAYYREFGDDEKARVKAQDLDAALNEVTDPKFEGYASYLREVGKDLSRIEPGGVLAPAPAAEPPTN